MNLPKPDKDGTKIGFIAGIISSLCCITPAAILLLGIGGTSFALSFVGLKPYFLIASILFLGAGLWWNKKKKKCDLKTSLKSSFTVSAVLIHVVIFVLAFYLLLPYVSSAFLNQDNLESNSALSGACSVQVQLKDTLSCSTCALTLEKHISNIKGVKSVKQNTKKSIVIIKYKNQKVSAEKVLESFPPGLPILEYNSSC